MILQIHLTDKEKCVECPLFSVTRPRISSEVPKAFCAVGRKIIKTNFLSKKEVKRPKWCPLVEEKE